MLSDAYPQMWALGPVTGESDVQCLPSLEWLLYPVSGRVFLDAYWEKQPLVIKRGQPGYFSSLLSLDEVDRVLTSVDLRFPNVTLKNADRRVTAAEYTVRGNSLDVARVYQLFEEGCTITLAYLDTVIPTLASFCRNLESEFSFPFQANVYLTPPEAKGAKYHYDTHDVFVLQVVGSKNWTIYGTPVNLPLRGQDFDSAVHERGAPTLEFELEPGDLAYIPRGVVHDARSGDTTSLHITAGALIYTWADFFLEWIADVALSDSAFRKSLTPGFARQTFDRQQAQETFRDLLQKLSKNSDFEPVLDLFVDEFVSACPPLLRGQLSQVAGVDRLTIDTVAGARMGVISRIVTNDQSVVVDCYGRRITFPVCASEAVRFALGNSRFAVRDLPGDLDESGKVVLVQRLIREGLVVVL